jgi:hypothetical protein
MSLPKGIYTKVDRQGNVTFAVRFMREGVKINLGTFFTAKKAIEAKLAWEHKDSLKHLTGEVSINWPAADSISSLGSLESIKQEAGDASAEQHPQFEEFISLLESVDPSSLPWHQEAVVSGVSIPANVVTYFQNRMFS